MKKQKVKNPKVELVSLILMGTVMFIAALVVLLIFYRPFVPWVKFVCSEENGSYEESGKKDVIYRYKINGTQYELLIKNVPFVSKDSDPNNNNIRHIIYVNANNPNDVKIGVWGDGMVLGFLIGFMILGVVVICFIVFRYKRSRP